MIGERKIVYRIGEGGKYEANSQEKVEHMVAFYKTSQEDIKKTKYMRADYVAK